MPDSLKQEIENLVRLFETLQERSRTQFLPGQRSQTSALPGEQDLPGAGKYREYLTKLSSLAVPAPGSMLWREGEPRPQPRMLRRKAARIKE